MRLRRVSFLLITALLLSAVFPGTVIAAGYFSNDNVSLSVVRVNPSSLSGAGTVTVTVNVSVDSSRADGGLNNVRVYGAGVETDYVQEITIGADATLDFRLSVSAAQLGSSIPLTLKWEGSGITSLPFNITVDSSAPTEPNVKFTRTVDRSSFGKGEAVTLIYSIENVGNLDITGITIKDDGVPGMKPITKNLVKAGQRADDIKFTLYPDADFTSAPVLTYMSNGKFRTATCASQVVSLKAPDLDVLLEASSDTVNSGDEVTLLCTLTNTGNTKLTNITISEKSLGSNLFTPATLEPGASKRFSRSVKLAATTVFQYEISAKDESNIPFTTMSNSLGVTVNQPGAQDDLEIVAVPDALQLSQPGLVNFVITVRNNGTEPITGATITDQDGNAFITNVPLALGENTFPYQKKIEVTTKFMFTLSVPGKDGSNRQMFSGETEVVIAPSASASVSAEPIPTQDISAEATADAGSSGRMVSLITALLVIGVLIIVTLLVLFGMIAADKRKRGGKKR